jgi:hypothetical protein
VLVLGNQRCGDEVPAFALALQRAVPDAGIAVLQIAHLVRVPRLVRKMVERDIRRGLEQQREALRIQRSAAGFSPDGVERLVNVGLDWDGEVTDAFGFTAATEHPLVALIDPATLEATAVEAPEPVTAIVELLAAHRGGV